VLLNIILNFLLILKNHRLNFVIFEKRTLMEQTIIENFWKRNLDPNQMNASDEVTTWNQEIELLYKLGISMEEAIGYLFHQKPTIAIFKNWINSRSIKISNQDASIANVLSEADLMFWQQNGYVVVQNAIAQEDCQATQNAIWEFLEKDPNDKKTWYHTHEAQRGLMVNFSNHPTLNKNRTSIRIQKAYEQLYETNKIYKTIDKVSFNPPITKEFNFLGSALHWDVSLQLPIPFRLQGLLYLSDCGENDGAFHCVPGFHHQITSWMHSLSPKENPREVALHTLIPKPVTGKAGDFIIWHQALPHCATPNKGKLPRMVQYLSYFPEEYEEQREWI
jgi:ectoine hydroxylase-related dioxygenase (phytanoyl-CoA dioxygenase family)